MASYTLRSGSTDGVLAPLECGGLAPAERAYPVELQDRAMDFAVDAIDFGNVLQATMAGGDKEMRKFVSNGRALELLVRLDELVTLGWENRVKSYRLVFSEIRRGLSVVAGLEGGCAYDSDFCRANFRLLAAQLRALVVTVRAFNSQYLYWFEHAIRVQRRFEPTLAEGYGVAEDESVDAYKEIAGAFVKHPGGRADAAFVSRSGKVSLEFCEYSTALSYGQVTSGMRAALPLRKVTSVMWEVDPAYAYVPVEEAGPFLLVPGMRKIVTSRAMVTAIDSMKVADRFLKLSGYCYLKCLPHSERAVTGRLLGPCPTVRKLVACADDHLDFFPGVAEYVREGDFVHILSEGRLPVDLGLDVRVGLCGQERVGERDTTGHDLRRVLLPYVRVGPGMSPTLPLVGEAGAWRLDAEAPYVDLVGLTGVLYVGDSLQADVGATRELLDVLCVEPEATSRPGYCYVKLLPLADRAKAARELGLSPLLEAVLQSSYWFPQLFTSDAVVTRGDGVLHVASEGNLPVWVSPVHYGMRVGASNTPADAVSRGLGALIDSLSGRSGRESGRYKVAAGTRDALSKYGESSERELVARDSSYDSDSRQVHFANPSGYSEVEFYPDIPVVNNRQAERVASLTHRLEKGTVVSRPYMRHVSGRGRFPGVHADHGTVVRLHASDHGSVDPMAWSVFDAAVIPGWQVLYRRLRSRETITVAPYGGADVVRMDITARGKMTVGKAELDTKYLVVWVTGPVKLEYEGEDGAKVFLFMPRRGTAVSMGWQVQLMQDVYPMTAVQDFSDFDSVNLTIPLKFVVQTDQGLARYEHSCHVAGAGTMGVKFAIMRDRTDSAAVISVASEGLTALKVGGMKMRASSTMGGRTKHVNVLVKDWTTSCVLVMQQPAHVKFAVDLVRDPAAFESAHVRVADSPLLSGYKLPGRPVGGAAFHAVDSATASRVGRVEAGSGEQVRSRFIEAGSDDEVREV